MDDHLLSKLGLSESEARLYKAVLKARSIAPAPLAKAVGVKRTTAYSMARGLVEKGLLIEDATRRPRVFTATGPEEMQGIIQEEQRRFNERQEALKKISEQASLANAEESYPVPRIRFIEENKLKDYFAQAFPAWNASAAEIGDLSFWGFQDATLVGRYEEQLHHWYKLRPAGAEVYLLTNLTHAEKKIKDVYKERHMKYWGEATDFVSSTWITGDYVIMINTRQHPHYAIEIHSRVLAHDQREVFRNLWPLVP